MVPAYHGSYALKAEYIARMKAHMAADQLVHGFYWDGVGKGCAVGCTLDGMGHRRYLEQLGIPIPIAHLEDAIFENGGDAYTREFPLRLLEAIPVSADLDNVVFQFLSWFVTHPIVVYILPRINGIGQNYRQESVDLNTKLLRSVHETLLMPAPYSHDFAWTTIMTMARDRCNAIYYIARAMKDAHPSVLDKHEMFAPENWADLRYVIYDIERAVSHYTDQGSSQATEALGFVNECGEQLIALCRTAPIMNIPANATLYMEWLKANPTAYIKPAEPEIDPCAEDDEDNDGDL